MRRYESCIVKINSNKGSNVISNITLANEADKNMSLAIIYYTSHKKFISDSSWCKIAPMCMVLDLL